MAAPKTGSGKNRADRYRDDNAKHLLDRLKGYGFIDQTIVNIKDLEDLTKDLDPNQVVRIKAATDIRMKLLDKIVPSRKAIELTGEDGGPVETSVSINFVPVKK